MDAGPDYARYLGVELRLARQRRGWTRDQVVERVLAATGVPLSRQALASYELGTRACTVVRLHQICAALAVDVSTVLTAMAAHAERSRRWGRPDVDGVLVDLDKLATSTGHRLSPIRAWARSLLDSGQFHVVDGRRTWRLTGGTFDPLSTLCDMPPGRLLLLLDRYVHRPGLRLPARPDR